MEPGLIIKTTIYHLKFCITYYYVFKVSDPMCVSVNQDTAALRVTTVFIFRNLFLDYGLRSYYFYCGYIMQFVLRTSGAPTALIAASALMIQNVIRLMDLVLAPVKGKVSTATRAAPKEPTDKVAFKLAR